MDLIYTFSLDEVKEGKEKISTYIKEWIKISFKSTCCNRQSEDFPLLLFLVSIYYITSRCDQNNMRDNRIEKTTEKRAKTQT